MAKIRVEVVYASEDAQRVFNASLPAGANLEQAISASGVLEAFPEIDLEINEVGIWAAKKPLNTVLKDGDRVEIYRPLLLTPTEARKLRAQTVKVKGV